MAPRSMSADGGKLGKPRRGGRSVDGKQKTSIDISFPPRDEPRSLRRSIARIDTAGACTTILPGETTLYSPPLPMNGHRVEDLFRRHTDAADRSLPLTSSLGASVIGLVRTIEDEILPRLKIAIDSAAGKPGPMRPTYEQIGELARLSMTREDETSLLYVEAMLQAGAAIETIYEDLLVAAARRLGEFWLEDAVDFSEVTVGTIRLQKIQRALSRQMRLSGSESAASAVSRAALRRALILPMPGDQHTFGATLVQDYFARAGWLVDGYPPVSESELAAMVRAESYDMVGMTVGRQDRLPELAACVALVRRASRNKSVVIAVGGPPFVADPLRAGAVGADATGATGAEAVAAVDAAITRLLQRA